MKYFLYTIIGLVVIAVLYFGIFNRQQSQPNIEQTQESVKEVQGNWPTKTDDQPPVTIKVTPVEFGKDAKTWKFQLVFDTHTTDLEDDVLKVVSLSDNQGNSYQPTSFEGPGPGGHHREGVIVFTAISPVPTSVELKIKNVGGIPERSFTWNTE